jgi:hypothetical protein
VNFLRNVCPPNFDRFEFLPSIGAFGGILTAWKSALFSGQLVFTNEFSVAVEFSSRHNDNSWILTNIYRPCLADGKREFLEWFQQIQMPEDVDWMIVGDFNLMRKQEDRNKDEGDLTKMFMFNNAISALGLIEIILQGRKYTCSNMQPNPLLQKLDWVFTSSAWNISYPNTVAKGLEMTPL